jgi:hypothetical protein
VISDENQLERVKAFYRREVIKKESTKGRVPENKEVHFADQIRVRIGNREEIIGGATKVATFAHMATQHELASYDAVGKYKPGDQIEWTITLSAGALRSTNG